MSTARLPCLLIAALCGGHALFAQDPVQPAATPEPERPVGFLKYPANTWRDQKAIWSFPIHAWKPKRLLAAAAVAGVSAALIATDSRTAGYFRTTDTFNGFNKKMNATTTGIAIPLAPAILYLAGQAEHDSYDKNTALMAGQALIDTEIVALVAKAAFRRKPPSDYPPTDHDLTHSWFTGNAFTSGGGFPSNHAIASFSVAAVFSRRYGRRHKWVPVAAYGAAALISFSRLTLSAHFPSDVFVGAALGYSISRIAMLPRP